VTKQKRRLLSPEAYKKRFEAEKAALARHYCDAFKLWRACHFGPCRRQRRCRGDAQACLSGGSTQYRAPFSSRRAQMMTSTPANAGPPEQLARQYLPGGF